MVKSNRISMKLDAKYPLLKTQHICGACLRPILWKPGQLVVLYNVRKRFGIVLQIMRTLLLLCYIGGGSETDAKLQATVLLSWCEHRSQTVRSASKEVRIHLRSYLEFGVKGCL